MHDANHPRRLTAPWRDVTRRAAAGLGASAACAIAAAAVASAPAHAAWADPQIASVDNARLEQADGPTTAVDLSADGRFVVFQTRASNFFADDDPDAPGTMRIGGIFRFDRQTGAIQLVADGDLVDEDDPATQLRRGAQRPSISDDGRYVAFSTPQPLVPQDANDNIDVYVRDMAVSVGVDRAASGAYALVSARDGGDEPARYAPMDPPTPGRTPGAELFTGQAISGDGRYVAFRTTELASDLPDRADLDTPPGGVFVRDLVAKRTVLVNPRLDGGASAGGALGPVTISRDGSTVVWVGANGPDQTRMVDGENLDSAVRYFLWRRWADPGATTRRVTGAADPEDPACPPGARYVPNALTTGPCYGPLTDPEDLRDVTNTAPALSADGWTVAYVSGANDRPASTDDGASDVFVTSMRPGVSRRAATSVITRGTTASNPRATGDVESVAMSADGSRLAIVTVRRQLLPPTPPLFGDERPSLPLRSELYAIDLTGTRATRRVLTPGGGELDGSVDPNPAMSADGRVIAFTTRAGNLVRGDANELADAFVVDDAGTGTVPRPPAGIGQDPIDVVVDSAPSDDFDVTVSSRRDGTLMVRVLVPEAGRVRAVARTRRARAARRAGARRGAARFRARAVARAQRAARRRSTVRLVLRLSRRDRSAVRRGTPLPVRVTATLAPARRGARARSVTANATFRFRVARRTGDRRRTRARR